jgi:hypothetical protein
VPLYPKLLMLVRAKRTTLARTDFANFEPFAGYRIAVLRHGYPQRWHAFLAAAFNDASAHDLGFAFVTLFQ